MLNLTAGAPAKTLLTKAMINLPSCYLCCIILEGFSELCSQLLLVMSFLCTADNEGNQVIVYFIVFSKVCTEIDVKSLQSIAVCKETSPLA